MRIFYIPAQPAPSSHILTKALILCGLCFFACTNVYAQDSTIIASPDSAWSEKTFLQKTFSIPPTPNTGRVVGVSALYTATWTATLLALNEVWYKDYPKSKFHAFDDSGEWLQVDKVGHAFSAYKLSQYFSLALIWSGIDRDKSVYLGAASGVLSQSVIEILDGYSAEWGFSWADMGANVLGSGLYAGQHALWGEQRVKFRFSNSRITYPDGMLGTRAANLYGTTFAELYLKDYNAQTYWLSGNIKSFLPRTQVPPWLNIAVGYGATGMYGGYRNEWIDKATNQYYNRTDIPRLRQFYLSPDIDFSRINTGSKFWNTFFDVVNLRLPLPALELRSNGELRFHAISY